MAINPIDFIGPGTIKAGLKGGENMILGQFIRSLENEMKQHPEQWYNYYDFWKLKK